jgi:biotin transporter BioY
MSTPHRRRLTRTAVRRLFWALFGIGVILVIGTVGFDLIAGLSPVDSFYFESMLATGQGPPLTLTTDTAKIFASIMAFISVGSVVSTLLFAVGPIVRKFWREETEHIEASARRLEQDIERHL